MVTVMVEVKVPPTEAAKGVLALVIDRSAPLGKTVTPTEAELLPGAGSLVAALMVAVLV